MDIEMIRLKSELVALETLVVALTRSLASWQPSLDKSLRATADELRERYRHLPMRDSSPRRPIAWQLSFRRPGIA